jgi:hypothetical protein
MAAAAAAIPLLKYLPVLGASLGGIGAYKQSGGNLGATALGSGLGALSMGGIGGLSTALGQRLAGTGLAARIAPEAYKAGQAGSALLAGQGLRGASQAIRTAGTAAPLAQQFGGQAVLAKGLPLALAGGAALALAPGAGQMAAQVAGPVQKGAETAAQLGVGALGYQAPGPNQYGGAPYLPTDMYGGIPMYGGPTDVMGPAGMGQRLDMYKTAETQRDINRLMNAENYGLREAAAKQDMARNMAAAGIRQNIATRASMQQRAQMAGIEAGRQALADAGAILRNQYQYQ